MNDPRQKPGLGSENDPNLGQKEAEEEKAEIENEDQEQDDELEPMTNKPEQPPQGAPLKR
jgi:hypothetical protein